MFVSSLLALLVLMCTRFLNKCFCSCPPIIPECLCRLRLVIKLVTELLFSHSPPLNSIFFLNAAFFTKKKIYENKLLEYTDSVPCCGVRPLVTVPRQPKKIVVQGMMMRCPWCNGYRRRKWTRRHEFKSWTRLIAFHIALIPLGTV